MFTARYELNHYIIYSIYSSKGYNVQNCILYGCYTRFPARREEYKVRVYGNGVLRGLFGVTSEELTRWRRKLHNFYFSPNNIRMIKS